MQTYQIVLIVVAVVLIAAIVALYIAGKKLQKKKAEQDEQMAAVAQQVTMLVIDKKKMKLIESGLPQAVIDQTPKAMRRSKLPIVKAKIGPKVMSLIADADIFDQIPVKKEIKATVSGLYITAIKGMHGVIETKPKKKTWMQKLREKAGM